MIGELDLFLFSQGEHKEAYEMFGAHLEFSKEGDFLGTRFNLWAPHAKEVRVISDFNFWNGENHKMNKIDNSGIWELFVAGVGEWTTYKYEIHTWDNQVLEKADPYAFFSELRPNTASKVYNINGYNWNDNEWIKKRNDKNPLDKPVSIYEVHLGSWRRKADNRFYKYNEIAVQLVEHVKAGGYTHIELMPVMEHPLDMSWGYQITGYYSASSRFGVPKDLMYLIDLCHQNDIGVILDWVPGHYCKDAHGLYLFDGEPLYEYPFDDVRENEVWGTANMDLGKGEVRSFLISNALFWMKYFHVDGFRIDAVSNLIYWLGNKDKGENQGAIYFLRKLNESIFSYFPNAIMAAEDSTIYPKVTQPTYNEGLGFNFKWNMGWMNDTLRYFEKDPIHRKYHHNLITFGLVYAFSEKFLLPLSHDEVVHGKKSLIDKMPGDYWQKFANYRLLIGLWATHPGKKLLFMGSEFAQFNEWKESSSLDWHLYDYEQHDKSAKFVRKILEVVKKEKSLYEQDCTIDGFSWIDEHNNEQSIFSFIRWAKDGSFVIVILNATPNTYHNYSIGVPKKGVYSEIINSDKYEYGGSNQCNSKDIYSIDGGFHGLTYHINITIPPLGIVVLKPQVK